MSDPLAQDRFAYARSADLCTWEELDSVLTRRVPGAWDEKAIWAPFIYQESGLYYLYYTGVTATGTQSILLATSTDPADPNAWQLDDMVFQPEHPGMVWEAGQWADCRDPTVIKIDQLYYLYYAGRDVAGSIIGLATAPSPEGPWFDHGSILDPDPRAVFESPTVTSFAGAFYLVYTLAGNGGYFRIGAGPTGPWGTAVAFRPGWAHEMWQGVDGEWFTSFLTDYSVTISPLSWDTLLVPPHPMIGSSVHHLFLPILQKRRSG
jgi:beta-xylosidase